MGDFRRAFIVSEALAIGFPKPGIVNKYPAYKESYLRLKTEKCSICFSRIGENRAIYSVCLHTSCLDCALWEISDKIDRLNSMDHIHPVRELMRIRCPFCRRESFYVNGLDERQIAP